MHPILFHIPLPDSDLPHVWVPLLIALLAALIGAFKLIGKEKDRQGAFIAFGVAALGVVARFAVLRGHTGSFHLGRVPIFSYGVMLGLSLVIGWYFTLWLAEREGLPKDTMANNYVVTAVAAVVGSRVLYILTNLSEFDSIGSIFAMRSGGLVAYGGFLGGFAASYLYLRHHKIPLLPWADVVVPSLAVGVMITRIGCYLFGCDFGRPLSSTAPTVLKHLGTFPRWTDGTLENGSGSPAWVQHVKASLIPMDAPASLPVHPTQLYESAVGASLVVILLLARRSQKFRGQIFLLFAFWYGACRYLVEILRDDKERGSLPFALPEHILVPFGLAIFAVGYVIGFSQVVSNLTLRRVTQVLVFVPVVGFYVGMKPESFAGSMDAQFSTSQFIALTSGLAAAVAFAVLHKAALAHPEDAMALVLAPADGSPALETDDDEEARVPAQKCELKAKTKTAGKPKTALATTEGKATSANSESITRGSEDVVTPGDATTEEAGGEPKKAV